MHQFNIYQRKKIDSAAGKFNQVSNSMPHNKILHAIELLGTRVGPEVRKYTAKAV
jgi:hypothetical protein